MYLILKTYANCDMEDTALTQCAVVDASPVLLDRLAGWMAKAAAISTDLGKDVTLAWMDYAPECYQGFPAPEEEEAFAEGDLDPGWCLMNAQPFPESKEGVMDDTVVESDAWNEPVRLSYCELRVSAKEVWRWYGPKWGIVEEYTVALTLDDLVEIDEQLAKGALTTGTEHRQTS